MTNTPSPTPEEPNDLIPLSIPEIRGKEWEYIKECLDTNWVSYLGPFVDRFERDLAASTGAKYATSTSSGTAALHLSLIQAGVQPEDEVILPGITFVAPANAVRYCFAWPTFVDISPVDWQIDTEKLADFLANECYSRKGRLFNKHTGRRIAALLPVHLLGGMFNVDRLIELAQRFELPLIEDAAECFGAKYKGRAIGGSLSINSSSAPGKQPVHLVTTSFNGNKIITTGGGGAIFTDDENLAQKAKHIATTAKLPGVEFFHDQVGFNYRISNIAAAMGCAQLEKLEEYLTTKRVIAEKYAQAFRNDDRITLHIEPPDCSSTYWLYTILLDRSSREIVRHMNLQNVISRPIWQPIYWLPAYKDNSYVYQCDFSEQFYRRGISLPCSVGLSETHQAKVVQMLFHLLDRHPS